MGRIYTLLGILCVYIFNRILVFYIRFLLDNRPVNFFQAVLLFGLGILQAYYFMSGIRDSIAPHEEIQGKVWNEGRDAAVWRTGKKERDGLFGVLFVFLVCTIILCLGSHLITWTALTRGAQFFDVDAGFQRPVFFTLWNGMSSFYLELPAYLVFGYRFFLHPYRSYYESIFDED